MSKITVKICGITNLADARYCAGAGADYLGFIQSEASPRFVAPDMARQIIEWLAGVQTVGVFVNADLSDVNEIADLTGFDVIQLHGNETAEYCSQIRRPVIKAIRIRSEATPSEIQKLVEPYEDVVSAFLFDTYVEDVAGGTGKTFSWNSISNLKMGKPFFVAGGLNPDNVGLAIDMVHPFGIDLSSGVEEKPGRKNFEAIDRLFEVLSTLTEG